jgi:hypothetical protein
MGKAAVTSIASMMATDSFVTAVADRIVSTAVDAVLTCCPHRPLAVVVAGSFGRDEATVLLHDGRARVLGDAEFYVIFPSETKARPFRALADVVVEKIERELAKAGIDCAISLGIHPANLLRHMAPHIMAYELRTTGKVVWGDPGTLELTPPFAPRDIPKWDAWRSVANRMIEQLACAEAFITREKGALCELLYRTIKLQLDLGTMVLHFLGAYSPTYRGRAEALTHLKEEGSFGRQLPCLSELTARVGDCTAFKLQPSPSSSYWGVFTDSSPFEDQVRFVQEECLEVIPLVRAAWLWGAERLLKRRVAGTEAPLDLALELARKQDWHWRVRGWLRWILTEQAWKKPNLWGLFPRLAKQGGPRFLAYAVAGALYFTWADWLVGDTKAADEVARRAMCFLPFGKAPKHGGTWLEACHSLVAGWERCLKPNWA